MKFNDVIFIHIPRTGGTYIESQLCKKYNVNIEWPQVNEENLFGFKKVNNNNYLTLQHLTINEIIKYNYFEDNKYVFTIIRHPYDRITSLFNNWFSRFNSIEDFLNKLEKLNINEYKYEGIQTTKDNFNFRNMTDDLNDIKYFVLPQYYYIKNNNNIKVNVIKFDEMEKLNDILNLNIKFKNNKHDDIDQSVKNKIYQLYKVDFDNFNFEK
jgi:hypothetical protein